MFRRVSLRLLSSCVQSSLDTSTLFPLSLHRGISIEENKSVRRQSSDAYLTISVCRFVSCLFTCLVKATAFGRQSWPVFKRLFESWLLGREGTDDGTEPCFIGTASQRTLHRNMDRARVLAVSNSRPRHRRGKPPNVSNRLSVLE